MNGLFLFSIAAGGAVGALLRHGVVSGVARLGGHGHALWGVLAVNVIGALLLGILVEVIALKWSPSPELRAFLFVGLLGGFTTFSAFSLEVVGLLQRGEMSLAVGYAAASVIVTCAALLAGMQLARLAL